ncbi:hypothetical protein OF829_04840 [Sphingomonas sp. LB-2]|uniref:hypothetical protein n=1 Tax=Sphingomonas caeni TaxID=2984949 RepID=UPI00222FCCC1|nr:hypothetical protein [Sphingomonas caeni]MCW3846555.1 hypothetical protein [Sphingomonas caeni]
MNFSYAPDKLAAIRRTVTDDRLGPYLAMAEGNVETAIRLYEVNTRLCADFYGPLQGLEVTVRNSIDEQFRTTFGQEWTDLKTIKLQHAQCQDVYNALSDVSEEDGQPRDYTHGDVIANLRFGFWVGVLGPKNETEIWRKCLWRAFPHRPKGTERKAVQGALNSIRRLRNRVAHHCRIIHRDLVRDHETILEVAGWVCPDTRDWIASLSTFDPSIIPVAQQALPMDGMPATDPMPPATPLPTEEKPTREGRPRLGLKG